MSLAKIPVIPLVTIFIITIIAAYVIAWYYREEYDPMRYIKAYLIYAIPFLILSLVLHVNIVLIIGTYLFGAVVLVFRNQHYFDH